MDARGRWNIKASFIGLLAYLAGVVVLLAVVSATGVHEYGAQGDGVDASVIAGELWGVLGSPRFLLICLDIGVPVAVFGGYVAVRAAPSVTRKLALPIGFLALFAGILFVSLMPDGAAAWLVPASLLFPLPLALVGGRLAGSSSSPRPERATKLNTETRQTNHTTPTTTTTNEGNGNSTDTRRTRETTRQTSEPKTMKQTIDQPTTNQTIGQQVQQIRQNELEHEAGVVEAQKQRAIEQALEQTKVEACEDMREVVRAAFMTHPAATEADFERCWPSLRDEVFKQHALHAYNSRRTQTS